MRGITHPPLDAVPVSTVLHALSDPVRLGIVRALALCDGELACGAFKLPLAKATQSHHFRVLREAGVIVCRAEGTMRLTSLNRHELERRFPGLLDAVLHAEGPV